jgi:serine/threonine protein kinase
MRANEALRTQRFGDYRLERLLGTGGMAQVYIARRVGPHGFSKRVAVKRILPQLANDARLIAMFCDEARIQAALAHPNLVQVLDFGEHEGELYMVMEYVEGLSCGQLIARVAARRRTVELGPALYIAREVCQALAHVHAATDDDGKSLSIIHRDVAPSNVLLGRLGDVKLGDFGIVRSSAIDSRTAPGELKGKVGYVSPEQALGYPVDGRSDLFSLAVVLSEMLLCRPLFPGRTEMEILENLHRGNTKTLEQHGDHIPADVRAILFKALSRQPSRRFADALEFSEALDRAARRHGESLGAHALAEWLSDLGLVTVTSEVQSRPAQSPTPSYPNGSIPRWVPPADRPSQPPPFSEAVTLIPNELDVPIGDVRSVPIQSNQGRVQHDSVPPELAHAISRIPLSRRRPSYELRRGRETNLGTMSLSRVLELCATGRVGNGTRVARDGAGFQSLDALDEIRRLCERPQYRFDDIAAIVPAVTIPISADSLPALLFSFVRERRTGLLRATRGTDFVHVYFADGAPLFTASSDPGELIGNRLVQRGAVTQAQIDDAFEQGWRKGRRLGEALVDLTAVRPAVVLKLIAEQRRSRLVELLEWRAGEVSFIENMPLEEEAVPIGARLRMLTGCVIEAFTDAELAHMLFDLESYGLVEGTADADALVSALELDAPELEALQRARQGRSLRTLVYEGDRLRLFDPAQARRAVFVGLVSGVLVRRV